MSTIELKKPVPIDVGGHPGKIIWLSPNLSRWMLIEADRILRDKAMRAPGIATEGIGAYVEFDPPVQGTAFLAVVVPIANLTMHQGMNPAEAFLEEVKVRAQDELFHSIAASQRDRHLSGAYDKRLAELDGLAQKLADQLVKE